MTETTIGRFDADDDAHVIYSLILSCGPTVLYVSLYDFLHL